MIDSVAARRAFIDHYPDRAADEVRLLGEGWDSIVYLVGETQILRFPKSAAAARSLELEVQLLPFMQARLPLTIPQPNLVGAHPLHPAWPFMGYLRVGGTELTRERFYQLSPAVQDGTLHALAKFLAALHAIDIVEAGHRSVIHRDLHAEFGDVFVRSQTTVAPLLDVSERAAFALAFESSSDLATATVSPTLTHGDLSPEHIF